MRRVPPGLVLVAALALALALATTVAARNPIRNTFFGIYPAADGTQLNTLPSNANHCGVCHFDFGGAGPRNPYGLGVEVGLDVESFESDLSSGRFEPVVQRDLREAQDAGIQGTPSFTVNEQRLVGPQPLEAFEKAIEEELQKVGAEGA